jgi:DNA-binding NarL/FixJ family response regulator
MRDARDGMVRRASLVERAGFKAALAVPILAEGEVVAVLVFFACGVLPEDKRTMDFISGTAAQLGSVVLRKRAEEELRGAREALEERVERRLERGAAYGLTFREMTVLHLVAQGKSDKEIAVELGISPLTAHKHLSNILSKMGAASRTEAGVRAVREGLLG